MTAAQNTWDLARLTRAGATILASLLLLVSSSALARSPVSVPGVNFNDWYETRKRDRDGVFSEFSLINYFFVRGTAANALPDPAGLRGVSLGPFGAAGGSATRVADGQNFLIEQRWIPVISFSPFFTSGWATFRAMVEVDFTWGIAANAAQQNQGGGLNADQINIQTKAVYAAIFPTKNEEKLSIQIGTQPVYDSVYNPHTTSLFDIVRTGYKLMYLGTDATAATVYSRYFGVLAKAAFIPIGAAQPEKATDDDPSFSFAWMLQLDLAYPVAPDTVIGLSYWRLQDDTQGRAFAFEGLVNSGPTSGGLSGFTGTTKLGINQADGHVNYLGLNVHHNIKFNTSDWAFSGYFMFNFGKFTTEIDPKNTPNTEVKILGFAANLEANYNWGMTQDDVLTLEALYASGDDDPQDDTFSGPFTLNYYGLPGAVWFNHRCLILFPFTSTVNNYTGAVTDISNQGAGLITVIATGSWDVIPHKLNVKLGAAFALAAADPVDYRDTNGDPIANRGRFIGAELNAEVKYHLRYLMTLGLHGGVMFKSKNGFFAGNELVKGHPWAAFTTFTWYAF
ncbi:MAG: hypothetical protein CSA65_06390 [Proteobacteria bacterium]|nr:MAG: hypothetical protein CSA65_06390 [Pseudomonadota bacterium]